MESRWVTVDGLRIHCLCAGQGEKRLLLLHGGSSDSAALCWSRTIQELSPHFQVLAPDLPGFGESEKPKTEYSVEFLADFTGKLVRTVGWDGFCLAGYSLGGWIALQFMLNGSSRVEKLVLVDSAGLGTYVPWRFLAWMLVKVPWLHQAVRNRSNRSRRLIRLGVSTLVANQEAITPQLIDEILVELQRPDAGRAWGSFLKNELCPSGFRRDCLDNLSRIDAPCLIIHGEDDPLVPVESACRAHRAMPDSHLVILPGCGHWPQKEKPEEFHGILRGFLA
jgi:pimeloyl-ACP methyl ester carboxylesterase